MVEPLAAPVSAFFVGPGKCGTSWVFDACRLHPALNVGLIKEPGDFLKPGVDVDAYHRLWRGPGIRCDFSNTYFFSDTAAEGISRYNPEARICITVRDPVARLVSQYMFYRRHGLFSGPINEAIVAIPDIVDRCRYHKHALKWFGRFGPDQILVLRLETLQADPVRYRSALFDFLGVPDATAASADVPNRLPAALPRSPLLARGSRRLAVLARAARLFRLIEWIKRSPLMDVLYRPLPRSYQESHLGDVPDAIRHELEDEYRQFVAAILRREGLRFI